MRRDPALPYDRRKTYVDRMGTDDKEMGLTATAVDAAKGLALEVYKDAAKPAVGNIGSTI